MVRWSRGFEGFWSLPGQGHLPHLGYPSLPSHLSIFLMVRLKRKLRKWHLQDCRREIPIEIKDITHKLKATYLLIYLPQVCLDV